MTHIHEFLGRRRVLEPRYRSMKYYNFRVDELPLKIIFFQKFFQESMPRLKVLDLIQFSEKNNHLF